MKKKKPVCAELMVDETVLSHIYGQESPGWILLLKFVTFFLKISRNPYLFLVKFIGH